MGWSSGKGRDEISLMGGRPGKRRAACLLWLTEQRLIEPVAVGEGFNCIDGKPGVLLWQSGVVIDVVVPGVDGVADDGDACAVVERLALDAQLVGNDGGEFLSLVAVEGMAGVMGVELVQRGVEEDAGGDAAVCQDCWRVGVAMQPAVADEGSAGGGFRLRHVGSARVMDGQTCGCPQLLFCTGLDVDVFEREGLRAGDGFEALDVGAFDKSHGVGNSCLASGGAPSWAGRR